MQSFSNVMLGGHLGDAPRIHGNDKENQFATMRLAINRKWKNQRQEACEATDWVTVNVPNFLVNLVKNYVAKGDPLIVQGELRQRQSTQGDKHYVEMVIVAKKILLVKKREENQSVFADSVQNDSLETMGGISAEMFDADFPMSFTDDESHRN